MGSRVKGARLRAIGRRDRVGNELSKKERSTQKCAIWPSLSFCQMEVETLSLSLDYVILVAHSCHEGQSWTHSFNSQFELRGIFLTTKHVITDTTESNSILMITRLIHADEEAKKGKDDATKRRQMNKSGNLQNPPNHNQLKNKTRKKTTSTAPTAATDSTPPHHIPDYASSRSSPWPRSVGSSTASSVVGTGPL